MGTFNVEPVYRQGYTDALQDAAERIATRASHEENNEAMQALLLAAEALADLALYVQDAYLQRQAEKGKTR